MDLEKNVSGLIRARSRIDCIALSSIFLCSPFFSPFKCDAFSGDGVFINTRRVLLKLSGSYPWKILTGPRRGCFKKTNFLAERRRREGNNERIFCK